VWKKEILCLTRANITSRKGLECHSYIHQWTFIKDPLLPNVVRNSRSSKD
jgi:hypothetical protein